MQSISIPNPSRTRALFIIDVQPEFIKPEHAHVVPNIISLIEKGDYEVIVVSEFRAPRGSLWDLQSEWTCSHSPTPKEITDKLDPKKTISLIKSTKSVFVMKPYLAAELRTRDIEEIHCVGYDANDCVLATADNAFDLGFYTYVIEEATESSEGKALRDAAFAIMRENEMTNHSTLIKESKTV